MGKEGLGLCLMVDSLTRIHMGEGEERLLHVVLCVPHIWLCTHAHLPLSDHRLKIKEQRRAVTRGGGNKGRETLSGAFPRSLRQVSACGG